VSKQNTQKALALPEKGGDPAAPSSTATLPHERDQWRKFERE